jgi:DNA repair exonuclease SbcCD ATPase subunit
MRSDVESETEESQRLAKVELDDLRLRIQSDLDLSAELEEKTMSRVSTLKAEVETLRIRAEGLKENKERRHEEVTELRSRVIALRKDLKDVESSLSRASSDADRLAQATSEHLKGSIREWELRVDDAQKVLERERERLREERNDVHRQCSDENNRIREKIAIVEDKKTHAIELMKRQLGDYRKRNSQLQAELETGRLKRLEMEN